MLHQRVILSFDTLMACYGAHVYTGSAAIVMMRILAEAEEGWGRCGVASQVGLGPLGMGKEGAGEEFNLLCVMQG